MESVRLRLHSGKAFTERVSKWFDFPGYHFSGKGYVLTLARKTIDNFLTKARRLYEQETRDITRIGDYARQWMIWATSGLSSLPMYILINILETKTLFHLLQISVILQILLAVLLVVLLGV